MAQLGAAEMAQRLRALAALAEDPGSVPSTRESVHLSVLRLFLTHSPEILHSLLASVSTRHVYGAQTYMQAKHSNTLNKIHFKVT